MDFEGALSAWQTQLGPEHVVTENDALEQKQTATFETSQQVLAIISPKNSAEVQAAIKIANQFNVPVYPISSGMNWGYGSAVPTCEQGVIMELSRLDTIENFSETLAHVTIGPGVTQQKLYDFLQQKDSNLWMDATGSSPDCSIIGNTVERGFGHTPYGDHFNHVCSMEVVLPSGEIINTGFSRFDNAHAASTYKWGVGAYVDGLFTQSNFGIVTKLTLWLMPKPQYFQAFYIMVEHDNQLEELIDTLQPFRLNRTVKSTVHIGNDFKVLSSITTFPWDKVGKNGKLTQDVVDEFAKLWDFGAWNVSGALYGTKQEVASARKQLKKAFNGKVKSIRFLDDTMLSLAIKLQKPYKWITGLDLPRLLKVMAPVHGLKKGIPTPDIIGSTFWRKKVDVPENPHPDRDKCGLIWCAPVAPTTGHHARAMVEIIKSNVDKYGFEPLISMSMINERSLDNVISIIYDREEPGQDEAAHQCHQQLMDDFNKQGYYPYRLGISGMEVTNKAEPQYLAFMKQLKSTLDPNNILAPGRYSSEK
ncbi:FAD-linked oxidase [Alteromonadales bacterium alter-6D02]|nr:FAD-linked oxidase [Alteromonadales bacterium alter-6D02]